MPRNRTLGLAVALSLSSAHVAGAQIVTSTDPVGPGTLHQAVEAANVIGDGAEIDFALPPDTTPPTIIILPTSPLEAKVDLTIDGATAPGLTIQSQDVRDHLIIDADPDVDDDLEVRLIDVNQGVGTIKIDGTLIFETITDVTVDSQISDVDSISAGGTADQFGALRKLGPATLFLNSPTSYSGDTLIEEGILEAKSQAVQGDIFNGTTLIINAEELNRTYTGTISDFDVDNPGAVEKIGVGTVTWQAPQTYTGGTIIRAGNLTIDSSTAGATGALESAGDVTVEAAATLEFQLGTGAAGTYTGTWNNAGTLVLDGEDELAILDLSGADATLGTVDVNQGVLAVQASALGGNITLRDGDTSSMGATPNGAVLRIQGAGNVGSAITGNGRLEVDAGTGTLTLSGSNDYLGGTTLLTGDLIVDANSLPGDANLVAGTQLIFDSSGAQTFDGILSGDGDVEKRGSGTLTMTGAHALTGALRISAGTLDLADMAVIAGDVSVDAGTFLSGGGTLGGITTVDGSIAPVGLRVNQANFSATSSLSHVLDPVSGTTGVLEVDGTGSVTLAAGTRIELTLLSGDYSGPMGAGIDFTLIDGDTGATVTDNGAVVDGDFAFVDVTILGAGEDFVVNVVGDIEESDLLGAAQTPNQLSVAGALFELIEDPAGDSVRQALMTVSATALPGVYDDAGGESISAFTSAQVATAQRFERGLHRRVRDLSWGSRESFFEVGPNPTPNLEPTSSAPRLRVPSGVLAAPLALPQSRPLPGIGVWSDVWGVLGTIDGDGNSSDTDTNLAGVSLAVDGRIDRHGVVGVALGYTYANIDVDGQDTNSDANGIQTAIYGGWSTPRAYLSAAARFAWARNESERHLVVGTVNGDAQADFDTLDYGVGFELGANLARFGLVLVQPVASFDWVRIERESFSESAGGALAALALGVDDDTTESLRTGLGLRASLRYPIDNNSEIVPELRARWLHEFGDEERIVRGRFRALPAGGGAFRVKGAESGSDVFLAGLGWSVSMGENVRIHADYDALVSSDALAHELTIALRARY